MTNQRSHDALPEPLLRHAARGAGASPSSACVEADTAAAWADGALTADESDAVTAHAADCVRCRTLLAAIVQTEPPRPQSVRWWQAPVLRWAAPLAAVAGALFVWVAVDRQPERAAITPALPPPAADMARRRSDSQTLGERPAAAAPGAEAPKAAQQANAAGPETAAAERQQPPRGEPRTKAGSEEDRRAPGRPATAPPAAPPAPAEPALGALSSARVLDAMASLDIVSPDGSSRWRLGQPGLIQRSTDGGQTWSAQPLDTTARLVAGVSPAPGTCWVVGAAGTVLKTTDGRTWHRLSAPDPADLVAVSAKDADLAIVTTADGRSFQTTDGGVTWARQ